LSISSLLAPSLRCPRCLTALAIVAINDTLAARAFLALKRIPAQTAIEIANTYCYLRISWNPRKTEAALTPGNWHRTREMIKTMLGWVSECVNMQGNKELMEAFKECGMTQADLVDTTNNPAPSKRSEHSPFWKAAYHWFLDAYTDSFTKSRCVLKIPKGFLKEKSLMLHVSIGFIMPSTPMLQEACFATTGPHLGYGDADLHTVRARHLLAIEAGRESPKLKTLEVQTLVQDEEGVVEQHELYREEGNRIMNQKVGAVNAMTASLPPPSRHMTPAAPTPLRSPTVERSPSATPTSVEKAVRKAKRDINRSADIINSIEDPIIDPTDQLALQGRECQCEDQDSNLIGKMNSICSTKTKLTDRARKFLVDAWYDAVCVKDREGNAKRIEPKLVCWLHHRTTAQAMGFIIRDMMREKIVEALRAMYVSKSQWGEWQAGPLTAQLFNHHYRARKTEDDLKDLESYRYRPWQEASEVEIDWDKLIKTMGAEGKIKEFNRSGTILLPLFDYIFKDPKLVKILDDSFKMYQFHLQKRDRKGNLGWLRTMYHSVIQQLVRGDLYYWLWYAMIRRDYSLVSYIYYTKFTEQGDPTYFRHIDNNIAETVSNQKGATMIQGSVSFDDEDEKNCTEMLSGFHRVITKYQEFRVKRGMKDSTGRIQGWDDRKDFPEEFRKWAETQGVKWEKIICKPGDARISHPHLPHGSTGPATKQRCTILPWFVKVTNDTTMEVPEMGTYEEIALAHKNLTAAPTSPSGHPNVYGGINWPFPADVAPSYTSFIQKAIMCQCKWSNAGVTYELRNIINSGNRAKIDAFFLQTRKDTIAMVKKHWEIVKVQARTWQPILSVLCGPILAYLAGAWHAFFG
jgi:hypothetical protein